MRSRSSRHRTKNESSPDANIDDGGVETVTTANWVFSLILQSHCIVGIAVISRFLVVLRFHSESAGKIDDMGLPRVVIITK
jgi:hypothetical protein